LRYICCPFGDGLEWFVPNEKKSGIKIEYADLNEELKTTAKSNA
jgi:hypothetical protein